MEYYGEGKIGCEKCARSRGGTVQYHHLLYYKQITVVK